MSTLPPSRPPVPRHDAPKPHAPGTAAFVAAHAVALLAVAAAVAGLTETLLLLARLLRLA